MESNFRKILLPVNSSAQSVIAQEMTLDFSRLFKSQVTLMYFVLNEPVILPEENFVERENYAPINTATGQFPRTLKTPTVKNYAIPEEVASEITENYRSEGEELLSESARLFRQEGLNAEEKLVEGADMAEAITIEAAKGPYDLAVIAYDGGEAEELSKHVGSVAVKVSSAAKIPILIVRQKSHFRRILIPIESSDKDEEALRKGSAIAKAAGSEIVLLYVQEKTPIRSKSKPDENTVFNQATDLLEGASVEKKIAYGNTAKMIIQTAKDRNVDLIVMSKGHGRLDRSSLGRVTTHVLRNAATSVMLVSK